MVVFFDFKIGFGVVEKEDFDLILVVGVDNVSVSVNKIFRC